MVQFIVLVCLATLGCSLLLDVLRPIVLAPSHTAMPVQAAPDVDSDAEVWVMAMELADKLAAADATPELWEGLEGYVTRPSVQMEVPGQITFEGATVSFMSEELIVNGKVVAGPVPAAVKLRMEQHLSTLNGIG